MPAPSTTDPMFPLPTIEAALERWCRPEAQTPPNLIEAMRYASLAGGKRLRPLLAWHACEALGGKGEASLAPGTSIEFIHAFSLVHDDLPALDNDDLRRGRPTLHKHAGEAMAILAGDALLLHAFRVLLANAPAPHAPRLIRELVDATWAMVRGQVFDTLGGFEPTLNPEERVRLTHELKTGALIRASVVMGGLCAFPTPDAADADPRFARLARAGGFAGLAFQVVDDLLDVTQTAETTGKRTGKDAQAGKLTYPGVLGIDRSRILAHQLLDQAQHEISDLGSGAAMLTRLIDLLRDRTH